MSAETEWFEGRAVAVPQKSWQSDLINAFVVTALAGAFICIAADFVAKGIYHWWHR